MGEAIRAMLLPIGNHRLWAEAVNTFIYVKNRQAHASVSGETSFLRPYMDQNQQ